jgi:type VI secretion system secreted protein VgrG
MNHRPNYLWMCFLAVIALLSLGSFNAALAQTAPSLGTASVYAALGSSTVTCTGGSIITGDVGVSPGSAITGFPNSCTDTNGSLEAGNAAALQAWHDAALAYAFLIAEPCTNNLSGQDLGGMTLGSGVYCFSSSAELTGTLNLTGSGPWIFQIGSTLTTATGAIVEFDGVKFTPGVCSSPVPGLFWAIGSSATLGTGTQFQGTLISLISDTVVTGTNVSGGVFALTGAVTLDNNTIDACASSGGITPSAGTVKVTGGGQIQVPDPTSPGTATFGFTAGPNDRHLNYVNHVNGLHIDGLVNNIVVIAYNPDGTPLTVLFSGTCGVDCVFTATVQDHGQPGTSDQFGITVTSATTGAPIEVRSMRVISHGNIKFHL